MPGRRSNNAGPRGYILYGPEFREGWGKGPWQTEPDEIIWYEGRYKCEIRRHRILGQLCGYVSVDRSHPAYKYRDEARNLEMHGGCTYTRREGNRWKIGFDCGHIYDLVPQINFMRQPGELLGDIPGVREFSRDEVYRNITYVENEIHLLIAQLEAMCAQKRSGPASNSILSGGVLDQMRKQRKRNIKWSNSIFVNEQHDAEDD